MASLRAHWSLASRGPLRSGEPSARWAARPRRPPGRQLFHGGPGLDSTPSSVRPLSQPPRGSAR
eukprot:12436490-Alexandrium_andersonii.AAC.1